MFLYQFQSIVNFDILMSLPIMINSFKECEGESIKTSILNKVMHKLLLSLGSITTNFDSICCCQVMGENKSMYITSIENFDISSQSKRKTCSTLNRNQARTEEL